MLIVMTLAAIFIFLKWITRKCYIPARFKVDLPKLGKHETEQKDLKQAEEHLKRKRKEEEEESLKEKPKDFFDEVDEMIAAKKNITPPSRPKSRFEGALFLSDWMDYERKVKATEYRPGKKKRLDKESVEEIKEKIRKCKF